MRRMRSLMTFHALLAGTMMLQVGGCTFNESATFLQTVFLGITAAGSIFLIRHI